jgi:Tol biopolymer transport system component
MFLLAWAAGSAAAATVVRVSVGPGGVESNGFSFEPVISANERYVGFTSFGSNLVSDDTNGAVDVFVHDRQSGDTERVSVASSGSQANSHSLRTALSASGELVAFYSYASNLVPDDTNGVTDVFVHDRTTGVTERVSVDSAGGQSDGESIEPTISGNGRYVAFHSTASNLVAGDSNGVYDIFVHDRETGETKRVSVASDGTEGAAQSLHASFSASGRLVAFESESQLVPDDTNGARDIFVHDQVSGTTTRESLDSSGGQANGSSFAGFLSASGRHVAFYSEASDLVAADTNGVRDTFVRDRVSGVTERISVSSFGDQGDLPSGGAIAISSSGKLIGFDSRATNLVADDTNDAFDAFVHDLDSGATTRVSVAADGGQGNGESVSTVMSASGQLIGFRSTASNLVAGDTNGTADIFVRR